MARQSGGSTNEETEREGGGGRGGYREKLSRFGRKPFCFCDCEYQSIVCVCFCFCFCFWPSCLCGCASFCSLKCERDLPHQPSDGWRFYQCGHLLEVIGASPPDANSASYYGGVFCSVSVLAGHDDKAARIYGGNTTPVTPYLISPRG